MLHKRHADHLPLSTLFAAMLVSLVMWSVLVGVGHATLEALWL